MQDGMQELYKILEKYKPAEEIFNDINNVQDMLDNNSYNKDKVIEIESKYSLETNFLMNLEKSTKVGFENNYDDPDLQVLINLRDRLYRIGVYKILKEKGVEIPKEIISSKYCELLNLVK